MASWKVIISPEFGDRLDLRRLTHDLIDRMEKDLGTRLEWVAVQHSNTEHPHVHVAVRGVRADGSALDLDRNYIRSGMRERAEELCTLQLGLRSEMDAVNAEQREIPARRYTSLDRAINRANAVETADPRGDALHFVFSVASGRRQAGSGGDLRLAGRLAVLRTMELAEEIAPQTWRVRRDFESVLRAMQRAGDRQKMLAAHGAVLSDDRLQLVVLDWRKMKTLEGRVVVHGEDELDAVAGRHYLLLEGTDARLHLIYYMPELEDARSRGQLRPNSFIRLRRRFENGRPILDVDDLGSADAFLRNRMHLSIPVQVGH